MDNKKYKIFLFTYISILGFIICLFSTFVSPLYDYSGMDMDVLLTIGRGWLNGKMPYRDLYDHKGFILHFLYLISALIKSNGYIGIFIIHTLIMIIDLFGIYKLISLFSTDKRYTIATMTISGLLMNVNFLSGNPLQSEHIAIGCYCYALYIMIKQLRDNITITDKQWYIIGITSSLLLWSKITLTGFYIGYIIPYFIICVKQKKVGTFIKNIIFIILGILTITIPFFIYMFIQGYFKDFIDVYFLDNMNNYVATYGHCISYSRAFLNFIGYINISLFPILLFFIKIKNRKTEKIKLFKITEYKTSIVFSFITLFLITFLNREGWGYYYTVFIIYTSLALYLVLRRMGDKGYFVDLLKWQSPFKNWKKQIILAIIPIIMIFYYIFIGNVCFLEFYSQRTSIIETVMSDIESSWKKDTAPNILEYDLIMGREYTKWDIVPDIKTFIFLFIRGEDAKKERTELIQQQKPDYIIACADLNISGYDLIQEYYIGNYNLDHIDIIFNNIRTSDTIYLYKKKGVMDYGFYFNL